MESRLMSLGFRHVSGVILAIIAYSWIAGTALVVLVGSFFTFAEGSNLGLGLIQVQGLPALVIGGALGCLGVTAVVLAWKRRAASAKLAAAYCAVFVVCIGGAVLKDLFQSPIAWLAVVPEQTSLLVIIAVFLLSGMCVWKLARGRQ
ncbi:MAG TPA: hypothetical protein VMT53_06560 [Terriglobales bacterium]|nr:hypothetical protein [Terriglobales bacterium]